MEANEQQNYYDIDRLSNSSLKHFARSPRHFLYSRRHKPTPTPAMIFGNVFHTLILEPDEFEKRYTHLPDGAPNRPSDRNRFAKNPSESTIAACRWWDEFNAKHGDKIIISMDDMVKAQQMRDALYKNEPAMELLNQITQTERELFWTDDITGVEMKGKMDGFAGSMTIDLKTTEDANPDVMTRNAISNWWDTQAALYLDGRGREGLKKGDFYFIAIEKSEPFGISVMKCTRDFIAYGRQRYGKILEDFAHWKMMGSPDVDYQWRAPLGYHSLSLPPWMRGR